MDLFESHYFRLERLANGVYAAIEIEGAGAMANAGCIDLGDRVLVFDTFRSPGAARELQAAVERLIGRPVTYVVNSHWHGDHVFGNQVFAAGADVIATEQTRELIATRSAANIEYARANGESYLQSLEEQLARAQSESERRNLERELSSARDFAKSLPSLELVLPSLTFDARLAFHGPARTVELLTFGGGHTASDAFLFLPAEKILFAGDLVIVQNHPWLGHGDPGKWMQILERIEALGAETIVPGHGPVGTVKDLVLVRRYIGELLRTASAAMREGEPAEDAAGKPIRQPFDAWGVPELYARNMRFLYEYLSNQG